jgi:hypothetical protein
MKRFVMAITLTSLLAGSTLAGEIPTVGFNAPPPDEPSGSVTTTQPGEVPSVGLTQQLTGAALGLIQLLIGPVA